MKNLVLILLTFILADFGTASSAFTRKEDNIKNCQEYYHHAQEKCEDLLKYNWHFVQSKNDCRQFDINRNSIVEADTAASTLARKESQIVSKTETKIVISTNGKIGPIRHYFYTSKAECKSDKRD